MPAARQREPLVGRLPRGANGATFFDRFQQIARPAPTLHDDVFPGVTTEAVKRSYMRAIRRAGIEDLRHEATTRLFEKGLNIMEVASITGHRDLRMLRRYTHLKAEDLARKLG